MGCINSKSDALRAQSGNQDGEQRVELVLRAKRQNVFTAGVDVSTTPVEAKVIPKSESQKHIIYNALDQNFIFATLGEEEKTTLVNAMDRVEVEAGNNIITQGDQGDYFYVIERGSFTVLVNGAKVGSLGDGKCFGELALIYNTPRQATVRADSAASVFSLDRETFRYTLARSSLQKHNQIQDALSRVPLLSGLTVHQLSKISDSVEILKFEKGDYIIKKGSAGNVFYIIKEGTVKVTDVGSSSQFNDHNLHAGDYFGERALITGEPRAANVIAETSVFVMALDRESFNSCLGPLREVLDHNLNMRVLDTIKLFSNLTERERSKVSRSFEYETFLPGTTIVKEGERGKKFYIMKDGNATVHIGGKEVGQLNTGDYFGEMALLDDEIRKATVIAQTNCECFAIDRSTFNRILGSLKDILARETQQRLSIINETIGQNSGHIEFKDLVAIATLGSGTFGRVSLVQHKPTKNVYALKAMLKSEIVMHKQQKNVMQEKAVMMESDHPFLLKLHATFKDKTKLYMLLEFIQGGELFSVVHTAQRDGVPDHQAKFYGAVITTAVSYLHSKDIAYRDMKPENCLIDKDGYPKLVDFGFAKVIRNGKSYTLCGTPEYLAPEIVLGRGHDKAVDYWALGILVFEMIAGYSPFSDAQGNDQVVICRNIVNGRVVFPRNFDNDCKELIKKLLQRDPITRLGNLRGGPDEIKLQRWFKDIDFDALLAKQVKAPWIPRISSVTDTSNFDPMAEDEVHDTGYHDTGNWDRDF